jgi:hypothetical protein
MRENGRVDRAHESLYGRGLGLKKAMDEVVDVLYNPTKHREWHRKRLSVVVKACEAQAGST